jgi:hypothetical protein
LLPKVQKFAPLKTFCSVKTSVPVLSLLHLRNTTFRLVTQMSLAALLCLALLSHLVPFAAASSRQMCTMACCNGMPVHAAGARSHTLAKPTNKVESESEVLCGLSIRASGAQAAAAMPQAAPEIIEADSECDDTGSCGLHQEPASDADSSNTANSKSPGLPHFLAHALTSPCDPECGCSASNTAQPRPGDLSALSFAVKPRPPLKKATARSYYERSIVLNANRTQLQPRAPPVSFI